jgi:hypothetical protein
MRGGESRARDEETAKYVQLDLDYAESRVRFARD